MTPYNYENSYLWIYKISFSCVAINMFLITYALFEINTQEEYVPKAQIKLSFFSNWRKKSIISEFNKQFKLIFPPGDKR